MLRERSENLPTTPAGSRLSADVASGVGTEESASENVSYMARCSELEQELVLLRRQHAVALASAQQQLEAEREEHAQQIAALTASTAGASSSNRTLTPGRVARHCAVLEHIGRQSLQCTPSPLSFATLGPRLRSQGDTQGDNKGGNVAMPQPAPQSAQQTQSSVMAHELAARHLKQLHAHELAVSQRRLKEAQVCSLLLHLYSLLCESKPLHNLVNACASIRQAHQLPVCA